MKGGLLLLFLFVLGTQGDPAVAAPSIAGLLGSRIKHIVVLMEENRSFDHLFGFAKKLLGVNGLTGTEYNVINRSDPASGKVQVDNKAQYIGPGDPDHSTPATAKKVGTEMDGFVQWEAGRAGCPDKEYCGVMSMFSPERVPIITELAQEYAVMDEFFCSHPGPTWPNRMFALSATSAGSTETGTWYKGEAGKLFPQRTIFDQVQEANLTWKNYYNDTPWEMFMQSIAHNPQNLQTMESFYEDAAQGTLPSYAWVNPRSGINMTTGLGANSQHPDHDVALGERLIKDVYEALRASPQWNETLFIITYDEHGGFYDHVMPPANVPSPGDAAKHGGSYPDRGYNFTSLGVRVPTLLISPWIEKGTVVSAPPPAQKPAANSAYDLTSIVATARKLLPGMDKMAPLTGRDAWAATFEHVLDVRDAPRTDMAMHLGPPPQPTLPPHHEANRPLNDLQEDIAGVLGHLTGMYSSGAQEGEGGGTQVQSDPQHKSGEVYEYHHPSVQGEISEWFQSRVNDHKSQTVAWQRSKSAMLEVSVAASRQPAGGWLTNAWSAAPAVQTGAMTTISTMRPLSAKVSSTYCLDGNGTVAGSVVTASSCYPSAEPARNRDRDQQWFVNADSTIRPAHNTALCLTAPATPPGHATLELCAHEVVEQRWSYHGPNAPGNNNEGFLLYGDFANFLGIPKNARSLQSALP